MKRTATLALAMLMATACSFQAKDLPLPGGPDIGDGGLTITAEFTDVLDLVPRSSVKVADVTVGEVDRIWLDGFTAKVAMRVKPGIRLPDNATARIRQTSLLGEKFVALSPPPKQQQTYGELGDGDVIPLSRTGRNIEVEEVLGAMATLLNGGGVAQLKTIEVELNKALHGRETDIKQLIRRLDNVLGQLDKHKQDITKAIDSLDRLAKELKDQRKTIAKAVDEIPAALTVLADQRAKLTKLLTEMSKLGTIGTRVIEGSRKDLLANLKSLDPVLTQLAKSGDDLPKSLQVLFTYPFADSAMNPVVGDYTNMQLTLDVDMKELLDGNGPIPLPTIGLPTNLPTIPLPTSLPTIGLPTELPTIPLPTILPTSLPTICLPLLCSNAKVQPNSYDPELARLLIGGVAR